MDLHAEVRGQGQALVVGKLHDLQEWVALTAPSHRDASVSIAPLRSQRQGRPGSSGQPRRAGAQGPRRRAWVVPQGGGEAPGPDGDASGQGPVRSQPVTDGTWLQPLQASACPATRYFEPRPSAQRRHRGRVATTLAASAKTPTRQAQLARLRHRCRRAPAWACDHADQHLPGHTKGRPLNTRERSPACVPYQRPQVHENAKLLAGTGNLDREPMPARSLSYHSACAGLAPPTTPLGRKGPHRPTGRLPIRRRR